MIFELEDILKELYLEYPELSKTEIELIGRSQFRYIRDTIQSGEYKTLNIKHLGKFVPKPKLKEFWINKIKNEGNSEYYKYSKYKREQIKASNQQESILSGDGTSRGDVEQEGCTNEEGLSDKG